jgi:hypothetical protein
MIWIMTQWMNFENVSFIFENVDLPGVKGDLWGVFVK